MNISFPFCNTSFLGWPLLLNLKNLKLHTKGYQNNNLPVLVKDPFKLICKISALGNRK